MTNLAQFAHVRRALLWTLAVAALGCTSSRAAPRPQLAFVERAIGAKSDAKLPLLIALHGLGDTPEQFIELFAGLDAKVRIVAPRAPDPHEVGSSWFPIDDSSRAPQSIMKRASQLVALAAYLTRTRATQGRPIVTGFSQGGILSFALAAYHAEHFQAAIPLAGALPGSLPGYRKAPPGFRVTALHGREDARIPYAGAERTVALLRDAGTDASLTGFAGVGHGISQAMQLRYFATLKSELDALAAGPSGAPGPRQRARR